MCMFSYYVNQSGFHRKNKKQSGKSGPGASFIRMMGPDYAGYSKDLSDGLKLLEAMPYTTLEMESGDGIRLKARLIRAEKPGKTAVMAHGYGSTGLHTAGITGVEYLRRGYSLLLPDHRASGESGGEWITMGILESRDMAGWLNEYNRLYPGEDILLQGTSMGGATVCMMSALSLPGNVRAIIADCPFADVKKQIEYSFTFRTHLPAEPVIALSGLWFKHFTGVSYSDGQPLKAVGKAKIPMLFVHGKEDRYVPATNSELLYNACGSTRKELLLIDGYGHAAACRAGAAYYEPIFRFFEAELACSGKASRERK